MAHNLRKITDSAQSKRDPVNKNIEKFQDTKIIEQVGTGLVPLIENGKINSKEMSDLLELYIRPMVKSNIDYLVLGCSHYPYLIPQIKKILPQKIKIIDSGEAVAKQTKNVLNEKIGFNNNTKENNPTFYTNSNPKVLSEILENKYTVFEKDF